VECSYDWRRGTKGKNILKRWGEMRRNDKEIKDKREIESIMKRATVCRIGLSENNVPYIVPMNYGYTDNRLYLHSAREGKKIDIIKQNNNVCFELDIDHELVKSATPCQWTMKYRSIIGFGKAFLINDFKEKKAALNIIRKHYSAAPCQFTARKLENLAIIKVEIGNMTGKISGY